MIVALEQFVEPDGKGLGMDNSHGDKQSAENQSVSNSIFGNIERGLSAEQVESSRIMNENVRSRKLMIFECNRFYSILLIQRTCKCHRVKVYIHTCCTSQLLWQRGGVSDCHPGVEIQVRSLSR